MQHFEALWQKIAEDKILVYLSNNISCFSVCTVPLPSEAHRTDVGLKLFKHVISELFISTDVNVSVYILYNYIICALKCITFLSNSFNMLLARYAFLNLQRKSTRRKQNANDVHINSQYFWNWTNANPMKNFSRAATASKL